MRLMNQIIYQQRCLFKEIMYIIKYDTKMDEIKKPPDPTKRTRNDRAEKLQMRKTHQETIVKCCLWKMLLGDMESRLALRYAITERVDSYSKRQVLASISLNYLVKELFHNVPTNQLQDVEVPDICDQTIVRQLLVGPNDAVKPNTQIVNLFNRQPRLKELLDSIPRHQYDRNIYSAGAIKLGTNIKNHFTTNLEAWVKKFIYSKHVKILLGPQSKEEYRSSTRNLLYYLLNWKFQALQDRQNMISFITQLPLDLKTEIDIQKSILGDDTIDDAWLKPLNLQKMVQYSVFINRFLKLEDEKLFNLTPLCTVKNHYMTIDSYSFFGILKDANLVSQSSEEFSQCSKYIWPSIIDLDRLKGKDKIFTGTIETDGVGLCVHFQRPKTNKQVETKESIQSKEYNNVEYWGCDPGRINIFYFVRENQDGSFTIHKLTRAQYYQEAGINQARKNTENWQRQSHIKLVIQTLSENSPKGDNIVTFEKYVQTMISVWDTVWTEYSKDRWSRQRLRLYGGKKRVYANFFNKIQHPKDRESKTIIVAFGSAKFKAGGKGEISVPTSAAFKECSSRFPTIPTCEFRTTKVYNGDKTTILQSVETKKGKKVRGLLWCCSTIENQNKFVDRDLNAAKNILHCLTLPERPPMMDRSKCEGHLEDIVGRKIKR